MKDDIIKYQAGENIKCGDVVEIRKGKLYLLEISKLELARAYYGYIYNGDIYTPLTVARLKEKYEQAIKELKNENKTK